MDTADFKALCLKYRDICHQKEDIENKILEEMNRRFGSGDWTIGDGIGVLGTIVNFCDDWNRDNFPFDQFLICLDKMKEVEKDFQANKNDG